MTTIAVDAMGGDYAPAEIVHGAYLAAKEHSVRVQLVGPAEIIEQELMKYSDSSLLPIEIVHAADVIDMGEVNITVKGYKCERCNYQWIPRKAAEHPKVCPRCKSPYWDKPRKAKTKKAKD